MSPMIPILEIPALIAVFLVIYILGIFVLHYIIPRTLNKARSSILEIGSKSKIGILICPKCNIKVKNEQGKCPICGDQVVEF